ncbi:hypothetical protein PCURB6_16610 [Paenibacillus curdlanolyticus]|nr:hypothetical protein PCURB6_16610 [Paenibacillus curdlanolyticus]
MHQSVLKRQERYANVVAFYSTLVSSVAVGLCFMFLTDSYLVTMIFLAFSVITVLGKGFEMKSDKLGGTSKYIYLMVFAVAPPTIMYMLGTLGLSGSTEILWFNRAWN